MYGDSHHQNASSIWAIVHAFVLQYPGLPICYIMGDLNNIMSVVKKSGPRPANFNHIANLCSMVKCCGLFDLGYNGLACTWTNKHFSSNPTFQRLDRFLANA
jgi:hypothetical protein